MDKIKTYAAQGVDTVDILSRLALVVEPAVCASGFVFAFFGTGHDGALIGQFIARHFPHFAFVGATSVGGFMTEQGLFGDDAIGLLVLEDAKGSFGSAALPLEVPNSDSSMSAASLAEAVLKAALDNCDCPGQIPDVIWLMSNGVYEEELIAGLRRLVGDHTILMGGSANSDSGLAQTQLMAGPAVYEKGIAIAVLFSSAPLGFAFQGGHEPAGPSGIVTAIGDDAGFSWPQAASCVGRHVLTIDHKPAAVVYQEWCAQLPGHENAAVLNFSSESLFNPLGLLHTAEHGVPHYILVHPEKITPEKGIKTFRSIALGQKVFAMHGDRAQLVQRAARVVRQAERNMSHLGLRTIEGGLVVYCAGAKLAIGDEIANVVPIIRDAMGGHPFMACFTYGEVGLMQDRLEHGNLMIAGLVFGGDEWQA